MNKVDFYKTLLTLNYNMVGVRCATYALMSNGSPSTFTVEELATWMFGSETLIKCHSQDILTSVNTYVTFMIGTEVLSGKFGVTQGKCIDVEINSAAIDAINELKNSGEQMIPVVNLQ